jgi:arylsulfatase A-like enzyme
MADDMRPQLGAYEQPLMLTPNLDALAAESLVFQSAYTQFAYCAPSRNSFMTGRRPERTRCLNFLTTFRKQHGPAWVAMPQFFKNAGYFTSAAGKLYHDTMDDPASWSYPSNQTSWYGFPQVKGDKCDVPYPAPANYCEVTPASEVPFTDEELVLKEGMARMLLANASGRPWWVGIGVHRPHWPSRVPPSWAGPVLYPGDIAPPKWPLGIPSAPYMSGAYRDGDYHNPALGCPNCSAPTADAVEYRRWYYAATTYADHMLGKALQLLTTFGPAVVANTIVFFHSDHGYQLGELNEWSKKTNTELATRVPLLVKVPWKPAAAGARTFVRAELVDLYRTLVDLAGLDAAAVQPDVQGASLAPLFDSPTTPPPALATKAAYSQIGSCACGVYTHALPSGANWTGAECNVNRCGGTNVTDFDFMGYSVRTAEGWRYTLWAPMNATTARVDFDGPLFDELYDQRSDKGADFDLDAYSENVVGGNPVTAAALRRELIAAVRSWY